MNCPNCGTPNRLDARFCRRCGATLQPPSGVPAGREVDLGEAWLGHALTIPSAPAPGHTDAATGAVLVEPGAVEPSSAPAPPSSEQAPPGEEADAPPAADAAPGPPAATDAALAADPAPAAAPPPGDAAILPAAEPLPGAEPIPAKAPEEQPPIDELAPVAGTEPDLDAVVAPAAAAEERQSGPRPASPADESALGVEPLAEMPFLGAAAPATASAPGPSAPAEAAAAAPAQPLTEVEGEGIMADIEPDQPTGPLDAEAVAAEKKPPRRAPPTRILTEDEAPETAPPVPEDPFPPLAVGTVVGDRYRVTQVLQTGPQHQTYEAEDEAGYVRCWACGSTDNLAGEVYCTDCGAQLTGRHYRLYETPAPAPPPRLPDALTQSKVAGVAQVLDTVVDSKTHRHYLVLEEVSGRPLSDWTSGKPPGGTAPEALSPERALGWLVQAADLLAELHKAEAIGCDFGPDSLFALPDDRLMLMDPVSCAVAEGPTAAKAEALRADVQRVAAGMEQWYHALPGVSPLAGEDAPTADLSTPEPPRAAPGEQAPPATVDAILAHGRAGEYPTATALAQALHEIHDADLPPKDLQLTSGRASDVGVQRQLNEDSVLVLEVAGMEAAGTVPAGVYIVADGMGGYEGGEVASSIAIRTVGGMLQQQVLAHLVTGEEHVPSRDEGIKLVREAILEANRRIAQLNSQRRSDMGTTITMALVVGNHATIANVGDSRTYLWRDGKLKPISQDHSLVARLIAAGQLTPEEGRHFERRNEIYRALGDAHLTADEVDIYEQRLGPFDALLLCSDGLWEMVRDEEMERMMLAAPDLNTACQRLVAAANKAGGDDNISVIIVQAVTGQED